MFLYSIALVLFFVLASALETDQYYVGIGVRDDLNLSSDYAAALAVRLTADLVTDGHYTTRMWQMAGAESFSIQLRNQEEFESLAYSCLWYNISYQRDEHDRMLLIGPAQPWRFHLLLEVVIEE